MRVKEHELQLKVFDFCVKIKIILQETKLKWLTLMIRDFKEVFTFIFLFISL